jgi:hypothetical protein
VVTARDIGARERLERELAQAQQMAVLGRFAGGVAHDFDNLLTAIQGYTSLLLRDFRPDDPQREGLEEIRNASERAAGLTRQILAFGRRHAAESGPVDLNRLIGNLVRLLPPLIGDDLALVTVLAPSIGMVRADPGQLEQVVMNLVINARDAMPDGGRLTIATANEHISDFDSRASPELPPGRYVMLTVRDTGTGIDPAALPSIFEPFFTTKERGKGTGLGLSVVHGILEQSDGFVDVQSEVGAGTTFVAYFPAVRGLVEYSGAHHPDHAPTHGNETVLLVEDQDEVRKLLRLALESQGYEVIEAANGRAGLAIAAAFAAPIHIVVTDVIMPAMNGREMVERLRVRWPELKALFISGYTDDALERHALIDAHHGYLQKPFPPLALASKIREMLDDTKRSRHLLFVDDEAPLVYLATRALEEQGYRVSGCENAMDALAAFMRDPLGFDLVVTDLKMKGMSGLQLAQQLRALRPELPVILASGFVDDRLRAEAAAAGVSELLCKPSTVEEFGVLIHRAAARFAPL